VAGADHGLHPVTAVSELMPVYPIEWRLPQERDHYPHMAKNDAVLWERFMDVYGPNFERFAYDVALGGFLPDPAAGDDATRRGFQYATALKIDAVGERSEDVWILEVRPHAGVSAIGAALCYAHLAAIDRFTDKPLIRAVVTDRASADIRLCAEALEVVMIEMDVEL
jgi:hypothetical protein